MSLIQYNTICFLQDTSNFDLTLAAFRLAEEFLSAQVTQLGKDISIQFDYWKIKLHLAEEPFVAEESVGIAEYFADCPRAAEIAQCKRRIEIGGDPDPNMDHFNDFVCLCQALEEFQGVILFDPELGQLVGGE